MHHLHNVIAVIADHSSLAQFNKFSTDIKRKLEIYAQQKSTQTSTITTVLITTTIIATTTSTTTTVIKKRYDAAVNNFFDFLKFEQLELPKQKHSLDSLVAG